MNKARKTKEKKIETLKKQLTKFGLAVPGTIRTTYLKCGKPSCVCWKDKNARHGPYYFWDRKVNGNLSSKSITKQMMPLLKKWIDNRKGSERLFSEMLKLGQAIASDLVETEKNSG